MSRHTSRGILSRLTGFRARVRADSGAQGVYDNHPRRE